MIEHRNEIVFPLNNWFLSACVWEGKNSSFTFDQSQSTSRWRKKWFFLFQSINCKRRRNNTGKERKSSSNWYQQNGNVTSNSLFPVRPHHYVIEVWMYISFFILFCLHGVFYKFLIQCKQWQLILMGEQIDEYIFVLSYHNRAKHISSRPLQLFYGHCVNHYYKPPRISKSGRYSLYPW